MLSRCISMVRSLALALLFVVPASVGHAQGAQGQYFPAPSQRGAKPPAVNTPFAQPTPAFRVGIGAYLGSHIPVRQEFGQFGEQFRPTFDIGGGIFVNAYGNFEIGVAAHGLVGGLETEPWEQAFGLIDPSTRHVWVGLRGRIHPFAFGQFRPMISFAYGGNRVAVIEEQGTGEFECSGTTLIRCDERTERTFTGGYWGQTFAAGGGFRVDPRGPRGISFVAEAMYGAQRYGRQTLSIADNVSLNSAGPVVRELMVSAGVVFLF